MLKQRIEDVLNEQNSVCLPIEGYQNKPLVSLEEAVVPLFNIFDEAILRRNVCIAKERCKEPVDSLSCDESASIMLYTFEWNSKESSLYFILNATLRMEDREKLKPWFLYLKLFVTALSRLPPIADIVFRGVKVDLADQYARIKNAIWWGFSSCTNNIETLQKEQFCGGTGKRTIFMIKCLNGRSIENHSYYKHEREIILLPGRHFQVTGRYNASDEIHMIQLQEVQPHFDFPLSDNKAWHRIEPGLCLAGTCNNNGCIAHQQEVLISIGFTKFDVLVDSSASIVKCPVCLTYVPIRKLVFSCCQWRCHGIKQRVPHEQPISYQKDWSDADEYPELDLHPQDTSAWLELVIETKMKS